MNINFTKLIRIALPVAILFLTACSGSSSTSSTSASGPTYTVGGTISGLFPGDAVVLSNNAADALTVNANSAYNVNTSFTFATAIASGVAYAVTAGTPTPNSELCTVNNGTGTMGSAAISSVAVSCSGLEMFAGDPLVPGTINGTGTAARFNGPAGLATDSSGNIYVADYGNNAIRIITPTGVVSTVAGTPGAAAGNADSPTPSFNVPWGITIDNTTGNLYVSDYGSAHIRKITPAGVVSTLVLTGSTLLGPQGIVFSGGNLYVADTTGQAIKVIALSTGVVTTLAGTGTPGNVNSNTGTSASFNNPSGITIDSAGNLYVADTTNFAIRKITSAGAVTTLAGTPGGGTPVGYQSANGACASAGFYNPEGITIDSSGNLYVADNTNQTIRKISLTPTCQVSTVVGVAQTQGFVPGVLPGGLRTPIGVAISGTSLFITNMQGVALVTNVP